MNQPITRAQHGVLDWIYAPTLAALPNLAKFENDSAPASAARIMAGAAAASTVMTRFEAGLVRVIPFKVHLGLDVAMSLFAVAAPWALGFKDDKRARNTFLAVGLFGLAVGALTQPKEMGEDDAQSSADSLGAAGSGERTFAVSQAGSQGMSPEYGQSMPAGLGTSA